MADADFGYVGSGAGKITLYKGKEIVKRNVSNEIAVEELINLLKESDAWVEPVIRNNLRPIFNLSNINFRYHIKLLHIAISYIRREVSNRLVPDYIYGAAAKATTHLPCAHDTIKQFCLRN